MSINRPSFVQAVAAGLFCTLSPSAGAGDNVVHQMLVNYQMKPEGGEGTMRLLEFLPDGKTLQVRAYSPSLGEFKTDGQNQFRLGLEGTAARVVG